MDRIGGPALVDGQRHFYFDICFDLGLRKGIMVHQLFYPCGVMGVFPLVAKAQGAVQGQLDCSEKRRFPRPVIPSD